MGKIQRCLTKKAWEIYKKNNSKQNNIITRDTERIIWELYKSIDKCVNNHDSIITVLKYYQKAVDEYLRISNVYLKLNEQIKDVRDLKIEQLEKQLAEKNKEIEKWKTKWCESEKNSLRKDQDKIAFAVKWLNKVKDALKTFEFNYDGLIDCCENYIFDIIDNQIKQLKKDNIFLQN